MKIKNGIHNDKIDSTGFYTGLVLNRFDLEFIKSLIRKKIILKIKKNYPNLKKELKNFNISEYHHLSKYINHQKLWPKSERLLSESSVKKIKKLNFFSTLQKYFGKIIISNEESIRKEEMYWRIVRPNTDSDVGPLHADKWFWDLNPWKAPKNSYRLKIWIPIVNESKKCGLVYWPMSHKKNIKYKFLKINGKKKPIEPKISDKVKLKSFNVKPGNAVIFHDNLLHGGEIGKSKTRVSIEFTMYIKKAN